MSLLLDALKKAADDKQKVTHGQPAGTNGELPEDERIMSSSNAGSDWSLAAEPGQYDPVHKQDQRETIPLNGKEELTELALELDVHDSEVDAEVDATKDRSAFSKSNTGVDRSELSISEIDHDVSGPDRHTISDDALSMMVDKTNRDVRKDKIILIAGLLALSLTILISGGIYFYMDAQVEMAAIERKHQIAIKSMQSKTRRQKTPEDMQVIRNLVSDTGLDEKVKFARQNTSNNVAKKETQVTRPARNNNIISSKKSVSGLSIRRTSKADPISGKLDQAWTAYDSGRYGDAKNLYRQILGFEEGNRDALLGMGAIAVVEKNYGVANKYYSLLLKQDPGDPVASAAIASLYSRKSSGESGEEYLLSMLRKNPESPHLNFSLANIYAQQDKWKAAQRYYFKAWQYDSDNADYIFNLAVSLDQLNNSGQALRLYRESLVKSASKQVSFSRDDVNKRIKELMVK